MTRTGAEMLLPGALGPFAAWCMGIAFVMVCLALVLAFVRLVKGPTLADRVVAIDLATTIVVLLLTMFGMVVDDSAYLDAAIALGLVAFLATVAFARYIERLPKLPSGGVDAVADYSTERRTEGAP